MKKVVIALFVVMCIFTVIFSAKVYATDVGSVLDTETSSHLIEIREKSLKDLEDFKETYGDETYGLVAYILDRIRFFSIPLCFLGIATSAIYQYVIGIRKLDVRYKGFYALIGFITILVICQILPFIFVIVVKFGRG